MKTTRLVGLAVLAVMVWAIPGFSQIENSKLMTMFPGWGVQAWGDYGVPWDQLGLVAEAFHFSPDGSFYELQDENTMMKIAVTFDVRQAILKHKIPLDSGGNVQIYLDGIALPSFSNQHPIVELDFSPGRHTLVMINNSCTDRFECWGTLVVGKCLWGTNKNISFVKAGLPDPE